jgi:hypothetical protein
MTEPTTAAAADPSAAYEQKSLRLKALAARIHAIVAEAETADDTTLAKLEEEKAGIDATIAELLAEPCAAHRETPNGGQVTCARSTGHPDDHFDELVGIGWANENDAAAAIGRDPQLDALLGKMTIDNADEITAYVDGLREQLHRTHAILDRFGVPRERLENTLTLVHRTNLFVDRLSRRLHTQVENNMALYNAIRDALTSLVGSPNASSLRIRSAIERLRGVLPTKKSPGGIHLQ